MFAQPPHSDKPYRQMWVDDSVVRHHQYLNRIVFSIRKLMMIVLSKRGLREIEPRSGCIPRSSKCRLLRNLADESFDLYRYFRVSFDELGQLLHNEGSFR